MCFMSLAQCSLGYLPLYKYLFISTWGNERRPKNLGALGQEVLPNPQNILRSYFTFL